MEFVTLDNILLQLVSKEIIPAISVTIGHNSRIVFSNSYGYIRESNVSVDNNTVFDIASMTKILTSICFTKLVDSGEISFDNRISEIFPEMRGSRPIEKNGHTIGYVNADKITWRQALTHTTGMGWARPKTRPSLPNLKNGLDDIFNLPFVDEPCKHIIYTDIPIILMGVAMERITKTPLDVLVDNMLCIPLSLENTGYLRITSGPYDRTNIAPTEFDSVFRKQRIWGCVHDENTFLLDGVAGHAGIFSTSKDMCNLAMSYNRCLSSDGFLSSYLAQEMITEQVEEFGERRGLMWQLNSSGIDSYFSCLSERSYGHAGFTGCFLWVDPVMDITIVVLTNDVYNGRENRKLFNYRKSIVKAIVDEFKS